MTSRGIATMLCLVDISSYATDSYSLFAFDESESILMSRRERLCALVGAIRRISMGEGMAPTSRPVASYPSHMDRRLSGDDVDGACGSRQRLGTLMEGLLKVLAARPRVMVEDLSAWPTPSEHLKVVDLPGGTLQVLSTAETGGRFTSAFTPSNPRISTTTEQVLATILAIEPRLFGAYEQLPRRIASAGVHALALKWLRHVRGYSLSLQVDMPPLDLANASWSGRGSTHLIEMCLRTALEAGGPVSVDLASLAPLGRGSLRAVPTPAARADGPTAGRAVPHAGHQKPATTDAGRRPAMRMRILGPLFFVGLSGTGRRVGVEPERWLRDEQHGRDSVDLIRKFSSQNYQPYELPSRLKFVYGDDLSEAELVRNRRWVVPAERESFAAARTAQPNYDVVSKLDIYPDAARSLCAWLGDEAVRSLVRLRGDQVKDWLPPREQEPLMRRARQLHSVGSAGLFERMRHRPGSPVAQGIDDVFGMIDNLGSELAVLGAPLRRSCNVFVAFSVAGGTGRGIFYDYLRLIGDAFARNHVRARIRPLGVMPSASAGSKRGGRQARVHTGTTLLDLFRLVDELNAPDGLGELKVLVSDPSRVPQYAAIGTQNALLASRENSTSFQSPCEQRRWRQAVSPGALFVGSCDGRTPVPMGADRSCERVGDGGRGRWPRTEGWHQPAPELQPSTTLTGSGGSSSHCHLEHCQRRRCHREDRRHGLTRGAPAKISPRLRTCDQ